MKKNWFYIVLFLMFFMGFIFRLKGFLLNPSFWHDECALGWSVLHRDYSELFGKLRFLQICPPMVLVCAKFIAGVFENNPYQFEMAARLVPFVFGVLGLALFPFLLVKIFKNKAAIIFAYLLFVSNQALVNYSFEFKQYSCDVFVTLAVLLFFMSKITTKKSVIAGVLMAIGIWFSFVSIIPIAAGLTILLLRRQFDKKMLFLVVPILISALVYLKIYLLNTYGVNSIGMHRFWSYAFINKDFSNLGRLLLENFKFFLNPFKYYLFAFLFAGIGIFTLFKKDTSRALVLVLTVFYTMVISWLQIYPFHSRLILFLCPVLIIFLAAPLEHNKKWLSAFVILLFCGNIFSNIYFLSTAKSMNRGYHPRELFEYMARHIKPSDKIYVNEPSFVEYTYYDSFFGLNKDIVRGDFQGVKNGEYWLYMPNEPLADLNSSVVLERYVMGKSILLYIKNRGL